ncbi:LLM class flavin-dependent oxidoreductase [Mycobacterium leprae]|uniref:LLM class flavin-dependent oxidoreductase n=1 Tax=Mycobacterium leprae TaxID=1769 RepID=UPI0003021D4B|nr:LLM class flavin-dependent oxidoreductase [Mycobacterium leprae]
MTVAGLNFVYGGQVRLGLSTSRPQVMEGFHGVEFDAPHRAAPRDVVEICRQM